MKLSLRLLSGLLVVLIGLGSGAPPRAVARAPDAAQYQIGAIEPNNSFGTATPIAASGTVEEAIFPQRDVDWYRMVVDRHGELKLTVTNVAPELDVALRVWNADYQAISQWYSPLKKGGDTTGLFDLPAAGSYYLEVRDGSDDAESSQAYQLTTLFTPAIDPAEWNGAVGNATLLALNTPLQATILPENDVDWYQIEVPHHGELQIAVTTVPAEIEMLVRVWNANLNAISDWFAPLAQGGDTLGTFDLPDQGTYYLEVRDKDDNARSIQPYTIQVNFAPAADPFEPNGEYGRATTLPFDQEMRANILPQRDVDWYKITVDHHGELMVSISEVAKELDMVFRVWDANGYAISNWFSPLAKGGNTEGIYDLPAPGRYYLEVRDGSDDARSIQPYLLKATYTEAVDLFEHNNSFGYASDLGTDRTVQANILPQRDSDWYGINLAQHGELQVEVTGVAAGMDINFRLWNSDLQAISGWFAPLAKGGDTTGNIDIPALGYYVLEVRDGSDDARSIQPYTLSIRFLAAPDPFEPNPNQATATAVKLDQTIVANILPQRDADWYQVEIPTAGDLHILVTNVAPNMDVVFEVLNAEGGYLTGWQAPLAKGGNTEAVIAISEPGTYFVEVRDGNDDGRSLQPYLLKMSMQPIDPATMTLPSAEASKPTTPPPGAPPPPGGGSAVTTTLPVSDSAQSKLLVRVSGQVGPTGGELFVQDATDLTVDGARLEVPPDLLDEYVTIHIATAEDAPPAAPFGLFPAGKYWEFEPTGLQFKAPVTVTLPVPAGAAAAQMFVGHWNGSTWTDLGGTVEDGLITAQTPGFSTLAVFCGKLADYRSVMIRNGSSSPAINLLYVAGPAPDPDNPDAGAAGCPSPVVEHKWKVSKGGVAPFLLRPGLYHLVVSYPQPQPGVANSLFLKVTPSDDQSDDELVITVEDQGAQSSDPNVTINFPGNQVVADSNLRPLVVGTAVVPPEVALVSRDPSTTTLPSHIVEIGPIKLEQMPPKGAGIEFSAVATDPEGKALRAFWTVNDGKSHNVVASEPVASGATITDDAMTFAPTYAGDYTIFLTVYDDLGLFDEMRWIVHVEANARPEIAVVSGRTHVEFGRLDDIRLSGVGAIAPVTATVQPGMPVPVQVSSLVTAGLTVAWTPLTLCPSVLAGPFAALPESDAVAVTASPVDALILPFPAPDVTNRWVNPGRTCVWALVHDADEDELAVNWEMPVPLYGEGTIYAAVAVPAGFHAKAPAGIALGAFLGTYSQLEAYNAWVSALFNVAGVVPAIVWEAWDDPCLGDGGVMLNPCPSAISRGGLYNVVARTSDGFALPPRVGYASILVGPEAFEPDCATVMYIAELRPNPSDPGPAESVWVEAVLAPRTEACPIDFSIVGTDNYANNATIWTNKDGEARFFVPGGAEDVVDIVTASVCIPLSPLATPPAAAQACTTQDGRPGKLLVIQVTYRF